MEWIDVKERLPENDQEKLCVVADETGEPCYQDYLSYIKQQDWWVDSNGCVPDGEILAWLDSIPEYKKKINRDKEGKWILSWDDPCYPICSLCKKEPSASESLPDFCPNCGAKMSKSF